MSRLSSTSGTSPISEFTKFVQDQDIFGLALGIIIVQTSIELSKNLANDIVKPVVKFAVSKDAKLDLDVDDVVSDMIVFVVTLVVVYLFSKSFNISPSRKGLVHSM